MWINQKSLIVRLMRFFQDCQLLSLLDLVFLSDLLTILDLFPALAAQEKKSNDANIRKWREQGVKIFSDFFTILQGFITKLCIWIGRGILDCGSKRG